MLAEAGYKGEKVTLINTHEIASIGALGDVTANNLKKLGINVEIADSDWGTLVARRAKKEPPAQGGWNIFVTTSGGVGSANPVLHTWIGAACDKGLFGWPCDAKIEELRNAYGFAQTMDEKKKIARELQERAIEQVLYLPFGQWTTPLAYRADRIEGIVPNTGLVVLWGIRKK